MRKVSPVVQVRLTEILGLTISTIRPVVEFGAVLEETVVEWLVWLSGRGRLPPLYTGGATNRSVPTELASLNPLTNNSLKPLMLLTTPVW